MLNEEPAPFALRTTEPRSGQRVVREALIVASRLQRPGGSVPQSTAHDVLTVTLPPTIDNLGQTPR